MNRNSLRMFGGVLYFTLIFLAKESLGDNEMNKTTMDFAKYKITRPTLYHGRTRREISSSRDSVGGHHSSITLSVPMDGEDLVLDLELNEDLVTGDHTLQYREGGKIVNHKAKKEELDLCHYHGSVRGKSNSWVAVSTCHGVSGVIFDGNKMQYIEPAEGSDIRAEHFIYDNVDLHTTHHCGNQDHVNNKIDEPIASEGQGISGNRANRYQKYIYGYYDPQILDTYNTNSYPRYVELVLVADYAMYRQAGNNVRALQSYMISLANIMNTIYAPLNIKIALVRVIVWSEGDEMSVDKNSDITLDNFMKYRQWKLPGIQHDHAQLLTGKSFFNNILGKAFIRAICGVRSASVASYSYFRTVPERVAVTLAHELGHSLGMEHDEDYCQCPDRTCVMYPSDSSEGNNQWSSCSKDALAQLFRSGEDQCLFNRPERMWNSL